MKTPTDTEAAEDSDTVKVNRAEIAAWNKRTFLENAATKFAAATVASRPLTSYSADDSVKWAETLWDALNRHTPIQ